MGVGVVLAQPWPGERACAVVRKAVQRKLPLFAPFPEFDQDDLYAEALLAAHAGWIGYDPTKGAWSTFVYTCAARRLLTIHRGRVRQGRRETRVAIAAESAASVAQ